MKKQVEKINAEIKGHDKAVADIRAKAKKSKRELNGLEIVEAAKHLNAAIEGKELIKRLEKRRNFTTAKLNPQPKTQKKAKK